MLFRSVFLETEVNTRSYTVQAFTDVYESELAFPTFHDVANFTRDCQSKLCQRKWRRWDDFTCRPRLWFPVASLCDSSPSSAVPSRIAAASLPGWSGFHNDVGHGRRCRMKDRPILHLQYSIWDLKAAMISKRCHAFSEVGCLIVNVPLSILPVFSRNLGFKKNPGSRVT